MFNSYVSHHQGVLCVLVSEAKLGADWETDLVTAALLENCSAFEMGYSCGKKLIFSASDIPHLDVNVLCKKKGPPKFRFGRVFFPS